MPTYEYEREDGTRFEIVQKITEDPLKTCPTTGQPVKRLLSAPAFHLKGSGWYKTDYASSGSAGTSAGSKASSSDASGNDSSTGDKEASKKASTEKSDSTTKSSSANSSNSSSD